MAPLCPGQGFLHTLANAAGFLVSVRISLQNLQLMAAEKGGFFLSPLSWLNNHLSAPQNPRADDASVGRELVKLVGSTVVKNPGMKGEAGSPPLTSVEM